jgi:enediyne biosynthesis protein E4
VKCEVRSKFKVGAAIACLLCLGVLGSPLPARDASAAAQRGVSTTKGASLFVDATAESGLDFTHINGAAGELLLPEVIGAGGALFDYDNDGDLDLFAVQGAMLRSRDSGSGTRDSGSGTRDPQTAKSRLFRNDLTLNRDGTRTFRFTDVTERSGIVATGYGMGAATGDIDNDGWVDLYVTYLGSNRMFRNKGDGTFVDVTARTGTGDTRWSTSATFFDYDRDGWLDLFVVNYVNFGLDMKRGCFSAGSARDYCNPVVYDPAPDTLYHNNRDGTFSDVSVRAGLARSSGRGLGVLAADVDADGWTDLYVANDGDGNQLWLNQRGSGAFKDEALLAGVAVSRMGRAQGSMGIDLGDVDRDGDEDLFVTNLDNEGNTLYTNVGRALFEDRTVEAGLFKLGFTGFGTRMVDYDNDGWLDVVVVNGAVRHMSSQVQRGDPYPLKQHKHVFHNDRGRFADVTQSAGPAFALLEVSRGLSLGDLDNDGDSDLVVFNNAGPARVLLNDVGSRRHWLGIRAIDGRYQRDGLAARVELVRRGDSLWRRVQADGSYCAASDTRVVFGLAGEAAPQTIRVHWPGGKVEEFRDLAVDRYWVLESGKPPRAL